MEPYSILYRHLKAEAYEIALSNEDGSDPRTLEIDPAPWIQFSQAPNGKFIVRTHAGRLDIARSDQFPKFRMVVEHRWATGIQIAWSEDGSMIAYLAWRKLEPANPFGPHENRLYVVAPDGSGHHHVTTLRDESPLVSIEGFNRSRGEIYLVHSGEGGWVNPAVVDVASGDVERSWPDLRAEGSEVFSSASSKLYYVSLNCNRLVEYSLVTGSERILYAVNAQEACLGHLLLDSERQRLFFSEMRGNQIATHSVDILSERVDVVLRGERYAGLAPVNLSPDGNKLFLNNFCVGCGNEGEFYVLDLNSSQTTLFFRTPHPSGKEWIALLAWLPHVTAE